MKLFTHTKNSSACNSKTNIITENNVLYKIQYNYINKCFITQTTLLTKKQTY